MAEYTEGKPNVDAGNKEDPKEVEKQEASQETQETTSEPTEKDLRDQARKETARAQGWKPKKEWIAEGGDPDQWRSAREFLDRGELLKVIKDTKQELRKVGEVVTTLSEHNKNVYKAGYQQALKELKEKKIAALEADDHRAVVEIDDRIDQTKKELARIESTPVQQVNTPQVTGAFEDFTKQNPWYTSDEDLQFWAHGTAIKYAKEHPNATEREVYEYLGRTVKTKFPEKFQGRRGPPSPDSQGKSSSQGAGKGSGGSGSFDKLLASLPEDQAKAARQLVKMGVISKEKYVEDYEAIGANR